MVDVSTAVAPLMIVSFSLEEDKRAAFDRFYQHQYLPKLLSVAPEIKNIIRYQSDRTVTSPDTGVKPAGEYLTIYELASSDALKVTDEIFARTGLAEEMAEFKRLKDQVTNFSRINYQLTYEHGRRPPGGRFANQHLLYFTSEVQADKVDEFRQWYQISYLPRLMADIPSISALRRYVSCTAAGGEATKGEKENGIEKEGKGAAHFLTIMESFDGQTLAHAIECMASPHRSVENEEMQKWLDSAVNFTGSNTYKPIFSMPN